MAWISLFKLKLSNGQENKHKFVQKVAKKIILLIFFKFSANISFFQTGSKRAIQSQMGSNWDKWSQTGEMVTIGAKQDQMGQSWAKGGQKKKKRVENGQRGTNLAKYCKI